MTKVRQTIGQKGEKVAADYLTGRGCQVIARNVRTEFGEIDLIVQRGEVLLFVEVKTRTSQAFGYPETGITPKKLTHMAQCAEAYLQTHPELSGPWQLDVLSIELGREGKYQIEWFENAS